MGSWDWWTTSETRCKDFKKLDKIERDGLKTPSVMEITLNDLGCR